MRNGNILAVVAITATIGACSLLDGEPQWYGETPADPRFVEAWKQKGDGQRGFVTFTSNRSGVKQVYRLDLETFVITQLTDGDYPKTYARISPNGRYVTYSQAQQVDLTQANLWAWNVHLIDLQTGEDRVLHIDGHYAQWASESELVFVEKGARVFKLNVDSGDLELLVNARETNLPSGAMLAVPAWSPQRESLLFTTTRFDFGDAVRGWATVEQLAGNELEAIQLGCQINWSPDGSYRYQVLSKVNGQKNNGFFRIDENGGKTLWLDMPGEFSHEYFPKLSNSGDWMAFGASRGDHDFDTSDYEIFLWPVDAPAEDAIRVTWSESTEVWPDIYLSEDKSS